MWTLALYSPLAIREEAMSRPPARTRGETELSLDIDDVTAVKPSAEHDSLTILPLYATPGRSPTRSPPRSLVPSSPTRDDPALVEPFHWPAWLVRPLESTIGRSRRLAGAIRWLGGPEPSMRDRYEMMRPWRPFARIEPALARWLKPLRSPLVVWPYLFLWLLGFALLMRKSQYSCAISPRDSADIAEPTRRPDRQRTSGRSRRIGTGTMLAASMAPDVSPSPTNRSRSAVPRML